MRCRTTLPLILLATLFFAVASRAQTDFQINPLLEAEAPPDDKRTLSVSFDREPKEIGLHFVHMDGLAPDVAKFNFGAESVWRSNHVYDPNQPWMRDFTFHRGRCAISRRQVARRGY